MHFVKLPVWVVGSSDLFTIGISVPGNLATNEKRAGSPKQPRPLLNLKTENPAPGEAFARNSAIIGLAVLF